MLACQKYLNFERQVFALVIKQIWFIKNERKLINYLCIITASIIMLYSFLSVWGISDFKLQNIHNSLGLLAIPVFSFALSAFGYWLSNHTKAPKNCVNEAYGAKQKQLKRDLIIGTNLMVTLALSFISLNLISKAKAIEGFGLVPVYLVIIAGITFYIIRIRSAAAKKSANVNDKKES